MTQVLFEFDEQSQNKSEEKFTSDNIEQSVISVEAEEVGSNQSLSPFDKFLQKELKKYDEVTPAIKELEAQFLPLKIADIHDKENYEIVAKSLRFVVSRRTAVEEKRKELKADSLKYGRAVDAEAKKITEMLAPIEQHLRSEKERIDNEVKRIEEEQKKLIEERFEQRHYRLHAAGLNILIDGYSWKSTLNPNFDYYLNRVNVETMSDEEFEREFKLIDSKIGEEVAAIEQQKKEEELKRQQQLDEINRLKKEQEEKDAELRKMQEELRLEKERMQNEIFEVRKTKLELMGLTYQEDIQSFVFIGFQNKMQKVVSKDGVMNAPNWNDSLVIIKEAVESLDEVAKTEKQQFEEQQQAVIQEAREKAEKELLDKQEEEKKKQVELEAQAKALEEERIANMSDKELIKVYAEKLLQVEKPTVKTIKWTRILNMFVGQIESLKSKTD
jgi:hypothetical protein